jgi:23S rRNA pseudouridine1911/1915/1917 synthase
MSDEEPTEQELTPPPGDPTSETLRMTVDPRAQGWRVDHFLSRLYPSFSRVSFQRAIENGTVLVNGATVKMSRRLKENDELEYRLPAVNHHTIEPEDIPLDVMYDDDSLIVINKAANMIVHPGRGNYHGTLAGALQFHFDKLSDIAGKLRAGIVHRLDRDTSGVLVVAKDNQIHHHLSKQFEERTVEKEYRAIVWGEVQFDRDYIETHVRVSQRNRERMMVCPPGGNSRHAATFYEVIERFRGFSFMRLCPQTGRTHQLRVHMHHLGHPIVADRLYEGHSALELSDLIDLPPEAENPVFIDRQALHAYKLSFDHPVTGARLSFEAPLPADFLQALEAIRTHRPRIVRKPTPAKR